ncbi:MAG: CYTH domain-containing protein [Gemmatimonadales bacterium]
MTYREIEVTLAVTAHDPEDVIHRLEELPSIGEYGLRPSGPLAIRDVYLDAEGGALREVGLGLRIRTVGDRTLITLKGPKESVVGGATCRREFEAPWSMESLAVLLRRLEDAGVRAPGEPSELMVHGLALDVMVALGLTPVHVRSTDRCPREVFRKAEPDVNLAELVIDSVAYEIQGRTVWHREVEIEVRPPGGISVMQHVAEELLAQWRPSLRRWNHGKRATGEAIEQLAECGRLEDLIGPGESLTPAAYDIMDEWINGN